MTNVSIDAKQGDPDQTAPTGTVLSWSTLFDQEASKKISSDGFCCDWCFKLRLKFIHSTFSLKCITHWRMCVIKSVTFKGGHLM